MTFNIYSTVSPTSSQATNLINYAASHDSFRSSEFIVFCDSEYSYYIVWGDLKHEGDQVVCSGVYEYIRYYRTNTSGYTGTYIYAYGVSDNLRVNLSNENIATSSLAGAGFVSSGYETMKYQDSVILFLVFMAAMIFAIMVKSFGRFET